ncbi:MAG: FAD-dependent oxidoreductase [Minisyncoccia bacterium]|jgi:alkyl hydroperoxide reductase subunit F
MYDLVIIGGGPGGVAAGVYAARKKIKAALVTDSFGGQSLVSNGIENWIGIKSISGFDLAKSLEEHLRAQAAIDIMDGDIVATVAKRDDGTFAVTTKNGKSFETKYILLTSGSRRKRLGVPGEDQFDGKGVVFCTTCDAPLFGGKMVAVVGGGNSALEGVEDLLQYASKIYLVVRSEVLRGDPVTQEKVKSHPNVEILWNTVIEEIHGSAETQMVNGVKYKNIKTGEEKELPLDGVFIEIGLTPNTDFVKDLVQLNEVGHVVVDAKTQQTSAAGIWAAGDVSDVLYDQNNISVGDAIKATLNIYDKIKKS